MKDHVYVLGQKYALILAGRDEFDAYHGKHSDDCDAFCDVVNKRIVLLSPEDWDSEIWPSVSDYEAQENLNHNLYHELVHVFMRVS